MSREPYATGSDGTKYWTKREYQEGRIRSSNTAAHRRSRVFKKINALAS